MILSFVVRIDRAAAERLEVIAELRTEINQDEPAEETDADMKNEVDDEQNASYSPHRSMVSLIKQTEKGQSRSARRNSS